MCDAHLLLINRRKEFSLVGLLLFNITLGILLRDTDVANNPLGVGGLDFIFKPCRQVHSAICNLSRAHRGPLNPLCALCISNVRGMSTQTSDPRCRDPPPHSPVPVSDGQKAISPNHSHAGTGWLPSRPSAEPRVKAACAWCGFLCTMEPIHHLTLE